MTPYTIRERRANIWGQRDNEAYPGQREKLLADLVASDAERARAEADLAVLARRKAGERRHIAAIAGTTEWVHDKPNLNDGRLPEAAFSWPIYQAATVAEVYGALWGQASPAEEAILNTLAHCAGLPEWQPSDPPESVIERYQAESR